MGQSKSNRTAKKNRQRPAKSKLPVLLLSGGVLMLVFAAFAILGGNRPSGSSIPAEVEGRPALKTDQEKVDLGDVRLGEWVSASFELTNAGDKPLRFSKQPYIQVLEGC